MHGCYPTALFTAVSRFNQGSLKQMCETAFFPLMKNWFVMDGDKLEQKSLLLVKSQTFIKEMLLVEMGKFLLSHCF